MSLQESIFPIINTIVTAIITVIITVYGPRLLGRKASGQARFLADLTRQNLELNEQAHTLKDDLHAREAADAKLRHDLDANQQRLERLQTERSQQQEALDQALAGLEETKAGHALLLQQRKSLDRRTRQVLDLQGRIWTLPTMQNTPRFRALSEERRTPIVSMLNLKGGVGKTTLTAYLAWALSHRGYRVLLIDLDLQGSLSSLFVAPHDLKGRDKAGTTLRHFLEAVSDDFKTSLKPYLVADPILGKKGALLTTTDSLAYAELNLTFRFLLRVGGKAGQWDGRRDGRFLLRRALHKAAVTDRFDVVLLDCPPLINFSCVNALAASDYVLIPVTCSRKVTERIPPLLARLQELRAAVNPTLRVMGMVSNRTASVDRRTLAEQQLWNHMCDQAKDRWGEEVPSFAALIPQRAEIRDGEDAFSPPGPESDLFVAFQRLGHEVEGRLPSECRRPAADPSRPC